MITQEIWKDIPGYDGFYQASTFGNFRSKKVSRKKLFLHPDGYYKIGLCKDGVPKICIAHKVIWDTFNDIKSDWPRLVVDHIDHDRTNNHLSNLQLLTTRQNVAKGCLRVKKTSKYTGVSLDKKRNKWVSQYRLNGKSIKIGYFTNELDAYIAYKNAVNKSQLNNPGPVRGIFLPFKSCEK